MDDKQQWKPVADDALFAGGFAGMGLFLVLLISVQNFGVENNLFDLVCSLCRY